VGHKGSGGRVRAGDKGVANRAWVGEGCTGVFSCWGWVGE